MQRKKASMISFRLHEEQAHKFKIACAVEKVTIQAVLEKAVADFIKGKKQPE
jgi:hypothetical protein